MTPLRWLWLILSFVGAAVPLGFILKHLVLAGFTIGALREAWSVNDAVVGLGWDLMIAAAALIIWICTEVWARRNFEALWAIPATLFIGVSCGLPLYLFLRTRPIV